MRCLILSPSNTHVRPFAVWAHALGMGGRRRANPNHKLMEASILMTQHWKTVMGGWAWRAGKGYGSRGRNKDMSDWRKTAGKARQRTKSGASGWGIGVACGVGWRALGHKHRPHQENTITIMMCQKKRAPTIGHPSVHQPIATRLRDHSHPRRRLPQSSTSFR